MLRRRAHYRALDALGVDVDAGDGLDDNSGGGASGGTRGNGARADQRPLRAGRREISAYRRAAELNSSRIIRARSVLLQLIEPQVVHLQTNPQP